MSSSLLLEVDSKYYPDQSSNDLTVYLDEEMFDVKGVKITQFCVSCSFYNISEDLKNNKFKIFEYGKWKNIIIPDGSYNLRNFTHAFYEQIQKITGLRKRVLTITFDEEIGKIKIKFEEGYQLRLFENNVLGFDVGKGKNIEIPKLGETEAVGDKLVNFRMFEYFCVHSNITNSVLVNGVKSDLLLKTFVKNCVMGDKICYTFENSVMVRCDDRFNKIKLWITDENNKPIDFKDGTVQYELAFNMN